MLEAFSQQLKTEHIPKEMGSIAEEHKPHAVCVSYPAQGHLNPMLNLAKLLHSNNFYITFVNTEYNHRRLLKSGGQNALKGLPDFQFKTIPDGLPPSDADTTQYAPTVCASMARHSLAPLIDLISRLNSDDDLPPVTCIIADCVLSFTLDAANHFGIPGVLFWTASACGVLGYAKGRTLQEIGLTPLKDASSLKNKFLDTLIDWIPVLKNIRLKDLPSYCWTTDSVMLNFLLREIDRTRQASAVILNTFDEFEQDVLTALYPMCGPIYTIGPLQLLSYQIPCQNSISLNLWKEQPECMEWLDLKEANSVLYINFGSVAVLSTQQITELAWGLANSKKYFLWIIRPDLVAGEKAVLPPEFVEETEDRGMLASWCNQEEILKHEAVGGFLSHMGWNSVLESICGGVPMICWPVRAEQPTNSRFASVEWGVGTEINNEGEREEIEKVVRELMDGEKGKEMKKKVMEWRMKAEEATKPGGSSYTNWYKLIRILQGN